MLDRLEAERRDSVGRALAAQEGERLRVAQELHDGVGQTLTGVVLQLGRVAARRARAGARDGVLEAQETARDSLEEVRRIARRLRPEALDDLGLASALRVLGERVGRALRARRRRPRPARAARVRRARPSWCVYRVAQEALTNVARHARRHARRGAARARRRPSALEVDDDGRGLRRATAARAAASAACASAPC